MGVLGEHPQPKGVRSRAALAAPRRDRRRRALRADLRGFRFAHPDFGRGPWFWPVMPQRRGEHH